MAQPVKKVTNALAWRYRRSREQFQDWRQVRKIARNKDLMPDAEYDPRIIYPCYKNLDEFIDVKRLKSLDGYIKQRVRPFFNRSDSPTFHSGALKLNRKSPSRPGAKLIELTEAKGEFNYHDLNKPDKWQLSRYAKTFSELMKFIETLPFKRTARMVIIADEFGRAVTAHRDHANSELKHEFIWFRTNLDKPLFMFNPRTRKKLYLRGYSCWFDTVNQFHGSDETGDLAISIRVDGIFEDDFRKQIPMPKCNPASTAALWASLS